MANAESVEVQPPVVASKKGSKLRVPGLIVLVLIVLGTCGFLFMRYRSAHASVAEKAPVATMYLPLEPVFVVNFQDDDATRYLQVGVTVMSHDPAAMQAVKDSDPVIRNALVMLFSSQTFVELSTTIGKQKLQAEALSAVRRIVAEKMSKPGIDALYFTSFVMQ